MIGRSRCNQSGFVASNRLGDHQQAAQTAIDYCLCARWLMISASCGRHMRRGAPAAVGLT